MMSATSRCRVVLLRVEGVTSARWPFSRGSLRGIFSEDASGLLGPDGDLPYNVVALLQALR